MVQYLRMLFIPLLFVSIELNQRESLNLERFSNEQKSELAFQI